MSSMSSLSTGRGGGRGSDENRDRRDGGYYTSPVRDVEPMDLDLSSGSPKASIFSTFSNEFETSGQGTESLSDQRTAAQSPISWKTASHAIGSVLSLRNHKVPSFPEYKGISKAETTDRPASAPVFLDTTSESVNPHFRPQTSAAFLEASSEQSSSRIQAYDVDVDSLQKRKKGYGIPESDGVFSHFPRSSKARTKKSSHSISKGMNQSTEQNSEPTVISKTIGRKERFQDKRRKMNCCCLLLVLGLMLPLLYLAVTVYLNHCRSLIQFDRTKLEENFKEELFGQHIAAKMIPEMLQTHFNSFRLKHGSTLDSIVHTPRGDCRPIVLSFHGGTGVGKTFVSSLISRSFHVVRLTPLNIPLIFPHRSTSELEAEEMYRQVNENLYLCCVNVFMVDEMDKAPDGAVDGLLDVIKNLSINCNPWYPSVFLFLSNTHASEINFLYKKLLSSSTMDVREELSSAHFESIFTSTNQWYDKLAQTGLVDAFIPFLPLEKMHAVQCIKRDLQAKGITVTTRLVDQVMKELLLSEQGDRTFSPTGCKRISDKVDFVNSKMEEISSKRDVSDL